MAIKLRCVGRGGREAVLTEGRWDQLTKGRRSILLWVPNVEQLICQAVAAPDIGTFDASDRRCHYLDLRESAPPEVGRVFLRVVCDHRMRWIDRVKRKLVEDLRGDEVDIDLVDGVLPRETTRWWPPAM